MPPTFKGGGDALFFAPPPTFSGVDIFNTLIRLQTLFVGENVDMTVFV